MEEKDDKYMQMAKGYEEMGEINLNISKEFFGAESEVDNIEVGEKGEQDKA